MYYVPDGTVRCGYYECPKCGERFLDVATSETIPCPYCEMDVDLEVGPDEDVDAQRSDAKLVRTLEGEEVEKMDALLSLAITGGNYEWI